MFIVILVHCLALLKLESVLYKNYRQNIEEAPLYIHHLNTWVYIKSHNLMVLELLIASRRFAFLWYYFGILSYLKLGYSAQPAQIQLPLLQSVSNALSKYCTIDFRFQEVWFKEVFRFRQELYFPKIQK